MRNFEILGTLIFTKYFRTGMESMLIPTLPQVVKMVLPCELRPLTESWMRKTNGAWISITGREIRTAPWSTGWSRTTAVVRIHKNGFLQILPARVMYVHTGFLFEYFYFWVKELKFWIKVFIFYYFRITTQFKIRQFLRMVI